MIIEAITEAADRAGISPLAFAASLIDRAYEVQVTIEGAIEFVPKNNGAMAMLVGAALATPHQEFSPRDDRRVYLEDDGTVVTSFGPAPHYPDGKPVYDEKKRIL